MHKVLDGLSDISQACWLAAAWLVEHISDLAWLAGLASVACGVGMVYLPAGVIAAGLSLCFAGYALGIGDTG